MIQEIGDSICNQRIDKSFNFIYNHTPNGIQIPDFDNENVDRQPINIAMVFDQIGNGDIDPEERLNIVPQMLELFSDNAEIIVEEAHGTAFEPAPVEAYLEKIALFRSIEQIEIIDAKTNSQGLCFEVRLREHHKGIIQ